MDLASAYVLCLLNCQVLDFEVTWSEPQRKNGGLEYSRSERDGENLVSKRRRNLVRNLIDIRTDSTIHW